jgi:hypothetical protein
LAGIIDSKLLQAGDIMVSPLVLPGVIPGNNTQDDADD